MPSPGRLWKPRSKPLSGRGFVQSRT